MINSGMQSLRCGLLAIVASLGLSACAAEPVDVPNADPAGDLAPEGVWGNSLDSGALTRNGLIANPRANARMITVPLATESYADATAPLALKVQLRHAPTRQMMGYLVSCALNPGQFVSYTDSSTSTTYGPWEGQLGLCSSWASGGASTTCQQIVSACLLSRVNAFNEHVQLSMRGQPSGSSALIPVGTVPTVTETAFGAPISSFASCSTSTSGGARNCGYTPNYVGTCKKHLPVNIGAGGKNPTSCLSGSPLGTSTGNTVLRVCDGLVGCNHGSPEVLGESGGSCGGTKPFVTITCPESEIFSVMSGPLVSTGTATANPAVETSPDVKYRISEQSLFSWQEGTFYGNLWGPGALNNAILDGHNVVSDLGVLGASPAYPIALADGAVFATMFACTGIFWNEEDAYMKLRVCAGTDTNCAATPMGACSSSMTLPCPANRHRCASIHGGAAVGDYDDCTDGITMWQNPITVYLNDPKDIISGLNAEVTGSPTASPPTPVACP